MNFRPACTAVLLASALLVLPAKGPADSSCWINEIGAPKTWEQRHPKWKDFQKAMAKGEWARAFELYQKFDTSCDHPYTYHTMYADLLSRTGDKAGSARLRFERIQLLLAADPARYANDSDWLTNECRSLGNYCANEKIEPPCAFVSGFAFMSRDRPDLAFQAFSNVGSGDLGGRIAPRLAQDQVQIAFRTAHGRGDWPAAAALARLCVEMNTPRYAADTILTNTFLRAEDWAGAVMILEEEASRLSADGCVPRFLMVGELAAKHGIRPSTPTGLVCMRFMAGDRVGALDELRDIIAKDPSTRGAGYMRDTLLILAVADAAQTKDTATLAALAKSMHETWAMFPRASTLAVADALARTGRAATGVAFLVNSYRRACYPRLTMPVADADPQGDPELLKAAAALALRTKLATTGDSLADAWLANLRGNRAAARTALEAIALRDPGSTRDFGDARDVAVAAFLAGDVALESGDARGALSLYHRATFALTRMLSGQTSNYSQATHYHEVLGVLRQCRALVALGQPGLADREMRSLLSVSEIKTRPLANNPALITAWAAMQDTVASALARTPSAVTPSDLTSAADGDVIALAAGESSPRQPAAAVLGPLRTATDEAYQKLHWDVESREREEKFIEYWKKYTAELEAAANAPAPAAASGRAFDFKGMLDKAASPSKVKRRCPRCLGSGRINYVTGERYYELDVHGRRTSTLADPPPCPECGGSGWK